MKKNLLKKLISLMCVILLASSLFAVPAFADDILPQGYADADTDRMTGDTANADDKADAADTANAMITAAAPAALTAGIGGTDTVAKMIPHDIPKDPDDPRYNDKNANIVKTAGDVIITVGSGLVPFGSTIRDFIKYNSPARDGKTGADLALSALTDSASFLCPMAGPLISVGKDIAKKIIDLF